MRDLEELFAALGRSRFRSRFRLGPKERAYLQQRTLPVVLRHARTFLAERLAPSQPPRDGRQTPMRGHPVFLAQHATATCCRACLARWHFIAKGRDLTPGEVDYVLRVIERWLSTQATGAPARRAAPAQRQLF